MSCMPAARKWAFICRTFAVNRRVNLTISGRDKVAGGAKKPSERRTQ